MNHLKKLIYVKTSRLYFLKLLIYDDNLLLYVYDFSLTDYSSLHEILVFLTIDGLCQGITGLLKTLTNNNINFTPAKIESDCLELDAQ